MSFSYNSTAPNNSDISWIRLRIGDNSSADAQLQDEEITALIASEGNKYLAAAVCAETIGAKYARRTDKSVGKLRISQQQASEHYFNLAQRLRHELSMKGGIYAGGISSDEHATDRQDTDLVQPSFSMGQFDYPAGPDSST